MSSREPIYRVEKTGGTKYKESTTPPSFGPMPVGELRTDQRPTGRVSRSISAVTRISCNKIAP